MGDSEKETLRDRAEAFGVSKDEDGKFRVKKGTFEDYVRILGAESSISALKNSIEGRLNFVTFEHPLASQARKAILAAYDLGKLDKLCALWKITPTVEINLYQAKQKDGSVKEQRTVSNADLQRVCTEMAKDPRFAVFME